MPLVKYIKNINTLEEIFVEEVPFDLVLQNFETIIEKEITSSELNFLRLPENEKFKLANFISDLSTKGKDISVVNYKIGLDTALLPKGALVPARTFIHGELQKVVWHSSELLDDPIIEVDMTYVRDSTGKASSRTTERYWYLQDGTKQLKKTTTKIYQGKEILSEMYTRRQNVVDQAIMTTLYYMYPIIKAAEPLLTDTEIEDMGKAYLADNSILISEFVNQGMKSFLNVIIDDETTYWMIAEIDPVNNIRLKDAIIAELDIWNV